VRAGLREQSQFSSGQAGGFNQSPLPLVFGLSGARQADYVHLLWSDGVAQIETAMPAASTTSGRNAAQNLKLPGAVLLEWYAI